MQAKTAHHRADDDARSANEGGIRDRGHWFAIRGFKRRGIADGDGRRHSSGRAGSTGLEYRDIIDYYDNDKLNNARSKGRATRCAPTADEAKAFVAWTRTRRGRFQTTMHPFELPIFDTFPHASRDGMEVGCHRVSISDDPDYDLPFRTTGYWSALPIWHHEPWHRM